MAETADIILEGYEPGPVEIWGRRLKMEYVGMASVFTVIASLIYGDAPWAVSLPATVGSFFLLEPRTDRPDARAKLLWTVPVAAVAGAATVFRRSIDSDRVRPFIKHAEWHFFWWVLALAVWAVLSA